MKVDIFNTDKKYNIIYADPPWSYKDKANAGKRGAEYKYPVMNTEDICALPVENLAADDCALFLWITMPQLKEAFKVIKSWGFVYRTCAFVWVKKYKKCFKNFMGMGNWTRSNAELCLIGIKGKPKRTSCSVRQIVESPIEKHSKKPDEVRVRIEELLGDIPRIELFARQAAKGWDCWGNEAPDDCSFAERRAENG